MSGTRFAQMKIRKNFFCGVDAAKADVYNRDNTREKEKKMENVVTVIFSSDCCGANMTFAQTDYGICPQCCEHCEVIGEEVVEDTGEY